MKALKGGKDKYMMTFNYQGEIHKIYTYAVTPHQAFEQCVIRLAQKLEVIPYVVRNYFNGKNRNYEIKKL